MRRLTRIVLGLITFGVAAAVAPTATAVSVAKTDLKTGPARPATFAVRAAQNTEGG